MSDSQNPVSVKANSIWTLPNLLTMMRLVLSVVMFVCIEQGYYWVSFVLFIFAAATDWFDGYFARKWGLVTKLGRILDPFADKVIICGTFIFLLAVPAINEMPWGLRAWMVAVIICRELLVTSLRGLIESGGTDFSANWSGKWKMAAQCFAAGASLLFLAVQGGPTFWINFSQIATIGSLWLAIILTIYSGLVYIVAAVRILRQ
jgi:CDP-diacylglycerol---glycerol-3-phosphate 3-phosphatidyltransferase